MSITGDLYNTDQSITGDGVDNLTISNLTTNGITTNTLSSGSITNTNGITTDTISVASKINYNSNNILLGRYAGQNNYALQLEGESLEFGRKLSDICIAIGENAGSNFMNRGSVCIGSEAGQNAEDFTIAIGLQAHQYGGGVGTISIGYGAGGGGNQHNYAVAIGQGAGSLNQGEGAFAMGGGAGNNNQGALAIAVGSSAGLNQQGASAIAFGSNSGQNGQGANAIAIGSNTCITNQPTNSIVLNATGIDINPQVSNSGFYVNPIRPDTSYTTNTLYYNPTSKELTWKATPTVTTGGSGTNGTNGISILYVGVYSSTYTYHLNNVVYDSGQSYLAIQDNFNNIPTSNTSYWALLVMKGAKGDTGSQGTKGDTGPAGSNGASSASDVLSILSISLSATAFAGLFAMTAATFLNGFTSVPAAGSLLALIEAAQDTADKALSNSLYFYTTLNDVEYCKASIQIKDSFNIRTVHTLDQNGNYQASNSISINPTGNLNTFIVDSGGNLTSNSVTTSQINPTAVISGGGGTLNIGNSTGNGDTINIGTNGLINTITIGNATSIINLKGTINMNSNIASDVFNLTSIVNQVGF